MKRIPLIIMSTALLAALIVFLASRERPSKVTNIAPSNESTDASASSNTNRSTEDTKPFSTIDLRDRDPSFSFTATIPGGWAVEYVAESRALSFYDPKDEKHTTSIERSKVFLKYFQASEFLTLMTVDIKSRTESTINGRPAVTYIIEKKPGVADFPGQPSWRNLEHRVTDIRTTDASPTIFYVFAKAPSVDDKTFETFLSSLSFTDTGEKPAVVPLENFFGRITKKKFGQLITKENSPVQPERFSGYHTGVDLETTAEEQTLDVAVTAIADGVLTVKKEADGYGGVLVLKHDVNGETVSAVYGHVRLSSVPKKVGESVTNGETIAVLGAAGTSETDGERKHLHFGLLPGSNQDIRGYVQNESELSAWIDPITWFNDHGLE